MSSPKDTAPSVVRRLEAVSELMAGLPEPGDVSLSEEAQQLSDAQAVLAAVLNNATLDSTDR